MKLFDNYEFKFERIDDIKYRINNFDYIYFIFPIKYSNNFKEINNVINNEINKIKFKNLLKWETKLIDIFIDEITIQGKKYKVVLEKNNNHINDKLFLLNGENKILFKYTSNSNHLVKRYFNCLNKFAQLKIDKLIEDFFNLSEKKWLDISYKLFNRKKIKNCIKYRWNTEYIVKYEKNKLIINPQLIYFKKEIIYNILLYAFIYYHNKHNKRNIKFGILDNLDEKLRKELNLQLVCFFKNFS